jgi:hypothetical protein
MLKHTQTKYSLPELQKSAREHGRYLVCAYAVAEVRSLGMLSACSLDTLWRSHIFARVFFMRGLLPSHQRMRAPTKLKHAYTN